MVWSVLSLMAVAAVLCVAWPLLRPRRDAAAGASDVAFYREQLRELDADVDRGVLRASDVEATRVELGRRLIGAADATGAAPPAGRRRGAVAAVVSCFVVALSAGLYSQIGHPGQPDAPLSARLTGRTDVAAAVAKIEAHLAADPDDGRGLEVIAPVYMRMGRFEDAARSYRGAIRVLGSTPDREAALGQALVMGADGVVTGEARSAFEAALRGDPRLPQARFFEGLAALQDGDRGRARATWSDILSAAPADAPYAAVVRGRLAELDGAPPAAPPSAPQAAGLRAPAMPPGAAAVAALPAGQQRAAIQGMVDGLASRLAQDGGDGPGWLRLVRAYRVLGEDDRAAKALADARRAMTGDPQLLAQLDALAHELGLES